MTLNQTSIPEIIAKKRDGNPLSPHELKFVITGYVQGEIPDYQISALLMAIYFQGMDQNEMRVLTEFMIASGDTIDLKSIPEIKVDKHSTGGVGDKVSLILAPLVAAAGVPVPMMSGRGLGHTGGTLDKLEAIPGFRTNLTEKEFLQEIQAIGFAMIGQTQEIVPADKKLYALRDVTGTIPSIPLICSSILSKKKAEGADALVLDVKVGKGAFLSSKEKTRVLAETLVSLGSDLGIRTIAVLTAMDEPLGNAVGNWLETREAIQCLKGNGPEDLMQVVEVLGGAMLVLGEKSKSLDEGIRIIQEKRDSGEGYQSFLKMTEMQGGDISVVKNPQSHPLPEFQLTLKSKTNGFLSVIDAREIGRVAILLGAGRMKKEDIIDPGAGLIFHKKTGDAIASGEDLVTIYSNRQDILKDAENRTLKAFSFDPQKPKRSKIIHGIVDNLGELALPDSF